MRSIFLSGKTSKHLQMTADDIREQQTPLPLEQIPNQVAQYTEVKNFNGLSLLFINNYQQLSEQLKKQTYLVLISNISQLNDLSAVQFLLKQSAYTSIAKDVSFFVFMLPQWLDSNDYNIKRKAYKLMYNLFVDFEQIQNRMQLITIIEKQIIADINHPNVEILQILLDIISSICKYHVLSQEIIQTVLSTLLVNSSQFNQFLFQYDDLLCRLLDYDEDQSFYTNCSNIVNQGFNTNIAYLQNCQVDPKFTQIYIVLLQCYFGRINRTDIRLLALSFDAYLKQTNINSVLLFLHEFPKMINQVPLVQMTRFISIDMVNRLMQLANVQQLQEVVLDVFLTLQSSFPAQPEWFIATCKCQIINENMAYAVSLIIQDFLEMNEAFWPELRQYWDGMMHSLQQYADQQEFIEDVIKGLQQRNI